MKDLKHLFDRIDDPEYKHLLLEPVLIYGVLIGILAFVFAYFFKERKMQVGALVAIIVSAVMVVPYLKARTKADKHNVKLFSQHADQIQEHRETRKDAQWAYFAVAALAGVTLLMGAHSGKPGFIVGSATVIAGVGLVLFSMIMHLKDTQIYHPNLRGSPEKKVSKSDSAKKKKRPKAVERPRSEERLASRYIEIE